MINYDCFQGTGAVPVPLFLMHRVELKTFTGGVAMKEFDFEQLIKKTVKQLKQDLLTYKSKLSPEFKTTDKIKPVELYQVRKMLTTPPEFMLIFHIEDTGLVHAVPLTEWVRLSPSNLRIYIANYTLAPLPFYVYVVKKVLEKTSLPIAIVRPKTVEKVLENVEKTPHTSFIKPIDEFTKLVWKRYEQLVLASLLYNAIRQEEFDN